MSIPGITSRFLPEPEGAARTGGRGGSEPNVRNIEQAAEEFESLLVAQMLKMFRESGSGGWMGSDQGSNPTMDLAETQLAKAVAQGGGLGIKEQIMRDFAKKGPPESGTTPQAALGPAAKPEAE